MITERIIKNLLSRYNFISSIFKVSVVKYHQSDEVSDIYIISKTTELHFCVSSKRLNFNRKLLKKGFVESFLNWEEFFNSSKSTKEGFAKTMRFDYPTFAYNYIPFMQDVINLIKTGEYKSSINDNLVSLVPINSEKTSNYTNQGWYKQLLQKYTEYHRSDDKSDIVEKHYQEQARLHGLKFIVR